MAESRNSKLNTMPGNTSNAATRLAGLSIEAFQRRNNRQTEATLMPRIKELFELARQCYVQANQTLNPEAKKALQDIGAKYAQQADELRRIAVTRDEDTKDKK